MTIAAHLDALPDLGHPGTATEALIVSGVPAGAVALLGLWLRDTQRRHVILVGTDIEGLWGDAVAWAGEARLGLFPAADTPAFDRVPPSDEVTRRRLQCLGLLNQVEPALIVASPGGLLRPTLPVKALASSTIRLQRGATQGRDDVIRRLVHLGYRRVTSVSSAGEFAVRGGIVDVYGMDRNRPWRAEWFGDEIDEIRVFDVESQTSVAQLDSVDLGPARELDLRPDAVAAALSVVSSLDVSGCRPEVREAWERDVAQLGAGVYDDGVDLFSPYLAVGDRETLLDHAPGALVICAGDVERLLRAAERHHDELAGLHQQELDRGELPHGALLGEVSPSTIEPRLRTAVQFMRDANDERGVDLEGIGVETFAGRFDAFLTHAKGLQLAGRSLLVITRQQQRVEELCAEGGVTVTDIPDFDYHDTVLPPGVSITQGEVSSGFSLAGVEVLTDHELFGTTKRRGSPLSRGGRRVLSTSSRGARSAASGKAAAKAFSIPFAPGDVVVHRDHGVGRFIEMRKQLDAGAEHEYMTLEYADGDRLYVPVAHLDRVDRYVGGADSSPTLSRLGTGDWERTKKRVKERTEEVARELITLYSRREMTSGHAYSPDSTWMHELEESFPYVETPDQMVVIEEIKRDMEASKPMDRVVCGDVGFGKTEIAVRAAFKAAVEGKQVAVLVPTTVLCQQHFRTFTERLAAFPVRIAQMSRFVSDDDIRQTLIDLTTGAVDIVVGTHRLVQKDVTFKNLGLVIIDEEQRFGVMQKERFKELRLGVDVLSLSATPIPRTLHMSLAGIRDLSVIQSPPEERQPIKTYVTAKEESLLREVITRELARGGQVFYVHNRVRTIETEAELVRRLVPEARIAVGHGQMPEDHLAKVMSAFADGEVDVLVATTIVESGLDIPNANTMIINDSHRFGLAQLYQLRGRVGRSGHRAYAYILYPPERSLTEKADKRLEVISELQDLGAGFTLAMRDLEIRGAGNLLGEAQHGEIAAVGLEMYNHLLNQAVTALQGKPVAEAASQVTVSLPLPAHLPASYVTDERLRLRCYQDLAACAGDNELDAAARGLRDRFGPLPRETEGLIVSLRVRLLAAAAGVSSVEPGPRSSTVVIQLPLHHGLELEAVARQQRSWLTSSPTRLLLADPGGADLRGEQWQQVLMDALRELGRLSRVRQRVGAMT